MTKRNSRTMKIVGLLLVVLVLVMFISTGQDAQQKIWKAWERYSEETESSSPKIAKSVKPQPSTEKKKSVNEVLKELSQPKEPTASVEREMTEEQKKFMFDTPATRTETVAGAAVAKQPPASVPVVVTAKAATPASKPHVAIETVKPPVVPTPQVAIAAVKPTVIITPRVSVQRPVRPVRQTSSQPTQRSAIQSVRQKPSVMAQSPKPKPLQPEELAQKEVLQVVNPITPSRDSRWNAVCEDVHGFGVPPTVQCQ